MSLLSVAYLLIAIISVGVTIFDIIQVRIHAQPKVWRILLYLAVAAFSLVLTLQQSQHFDDLVSGVFIVVMFICFACWQKGLADAAMIGGLGSIRLYQNLSGVVLQANAGGYAAIGASRSSDGFKTAVSPVANRSTKLFGR